MCCVHRQVHLRRAIEVCTLVTSFMSGLCIFCYKSHPSRTRQLGEIYRNHFLINSIAIVIFLLLFLNAKRTICTFIAVIYVPWLIPVSAPFRVLALRKRASLSRVCRCHGGITRVSALPIVAFASKSRRSSSRGISFCMRR